MTVALLIWAGAATLAAAHQRWRRKLVERELVYIGERYERAVRRERELAQALERGLAERRLRVIEGGRR